jgi:hypothetical protein
MEVNWTKDRQKLKRRITTQVAKTKKIDFSWKGHLL